jgi:hypothetical protein
VLIMLDSMRSEVSAEETCIRAGTYPPHGQVTTTKPIITASKAWSTHLKTHRRKSRFCPPHTRSIPNTITRQARDNYEKTPIMSPTNRLGPSKTSEKDTASTKSVSTMASTKSLLRSLLPHKRSENASETNNTESPARKAERKLNRAEALNHHMIHK